MAWKNISLVALVVGCLAPFSVACTGPQADDAASADSDIVSDILSMTRNEDGTFRVQCLDRATGNPYTEESVTSDQVKADDVCRRSAPTPPPAPVVVTGTFTCAGNAEVFGEFLSPDGTERTEKRRIVALPPQTATILVSAMLPRVSASLVASARQRFQSPVGTVIADSLASGVTNWAMTSALPAQVKVP